MANWLDKFEDGGDVPSKYNTIPTGILKRPTVLSTTGGSYYSPSEQTIYLNPDEYAKDPSVYQHEMFHHWQNLNDQLRVPEVYEGPLAKPNMLANNTGDYYNRRRVEIDNEFYNFFDIAPTFRLVNPDLIYDKQVNPSLYKYSDYGEGEAEEYQNYVRGGGTPVFMHKQGGLIKRADGSYSRRGLWDNIRANRGSGRKPTAEMLRQERKIKKHEDGSFVTDGNGNGGGGNNGIITHPNDNTLLTLPVMDKLQIITPLNKDVSAREKEIYEKNAFNTYKNFLIEQENANKEGYDSKSGLWFPYKSPEGGTKTLAYGRKLTEQEEALGTYSKGVPTAEVMKMLDSDIQSNYIRAGKYFNATYKDTGVTWESLPIEQRLFLTDYQYGTKSGLAGWPNLTKGVIAYNKATTDAEKAAAINKISSEYKRGIKGQGLLTKRNAGIYSDYITPIFINPAAVNSETVKKLYNKGVTPSKKANGSWVTDSSLPTPTTPSFYDAYPDRTLTNYQMGTDKAPMYKNGSVVGEDIPIDPRTGKPAVLLKEVQVVGKRNTPIDSSNVRESTAVNTPKIKDPIIKNAFTDDEFNLDFGVSYANKLLKEHNVKVDSTGNILENLGLPSSAYYNPFSRTIHYNSNADNSETAKRKYLKRVIAEIPHAIQSDRMGVIPFAVNIGIDALNNPSTSRYRQKGTLENEAHHIIEPQLQDKLYQNAFNYDYPYKQGGPVMYREGATVWTNQDTPLWAAGTPTPTATQNFRNDRSLNTDLYRIGDVIPTGMNYKTPAAGTYDYSKDIQPYYTMRLHAPDTTRMGDGGPTPSAIPYRKPNTLGTPEVTKLTPAQEIAYQRYKQSLGDVGGDDDYDLRGFWKAEGFKGLTDSGKNGVHFTDQYKILNFDSPYREYNALSDESKYASEFDRRGQGYWAPIDEVPLDNRTENYGEGWQFRPYKHGGHIKKHVNSPRVYGSPVNPSGMSEGPTMQRGTMMFGGGGTTGYDQAKAQYIAASNRGIMGEKQMQDLVKQYPQLANDASLSGQRAIGNAAMYRNKEEANRVVTNTLGQVISTPYSRAKQQREEIVKRRPEVYNVQDYYQFGIQEPGASNDVTNDPIAMALLGTAIGGVGLGTRGAKALATDFVGNLASEATLGATDLTKGGFKIGENLFKNIKTPKVIQNFSDAYKSTKSLMGEVTGELLHGFENRKAIQEGNEWFANWVAHPKTQAKIEDSINKAIDLRNQYYHQDVTKHIEDLNNGVINQIQFNNFIDDINFDYNHEVGKLNLFKDQAKNYKNYSKEYPLKKQFEENFLQYFGKGKANIHLDNAGMSYVHYKKPYGTLLDMPTSLRNSGNWISRKYPNFLKKIGTTIHENTHGWATNFGLGASGQKNFILSLMPKEVKANYLEWKNLGGGEKALKELGEKNAFKGYIANPTEMHARTMELRKAFDLTPDDIIDETMAADMMETMRSNRHIINGQEEYLDTFGRDPKKMASLFNNLWVAAPAAIGAGMYNAPSTQTEQKQADGGYVKNNNSNTWLDSYN